MSDAIIAQLKAILSIDMSGFSAGVDAAQKKIDGIGSGADKLAVNLQALASTATKLGAALTAAFTVPALAAAKIGADFVQMKQSAEIAFGVMLRDTTKAKALFSDLQKFAASTPFDLPDVVKNTQRLMAMGFAAKDAIPVMRVLGDATAAVGGSGETLNRIAVAIGQIRTAGTLKTQDLNQLTDAGLPVFDILSKKMGKSVSELRDELQKGAIDSQTAINAILGGIDERYGGVMSKMGATWATTVSNLKDNAQQALGALFEPAIKSATEFLQTVTQVLGTVRDKFASMSEETRTRIVEVIAVLASIGPATLAIGGIAAAFEAVLNPIGLVVAAVAAFAVAYINDVNGMKSATNQTVSEIGAVLYKIAPYIMLAFDAALNTIKAFVAAAGPVLSSWAQDISENFAALVTTIQTVMGAISNVIQANVEFISNVFSALGRAITSPLGGLDILQSAWKRVWEFLDSITFGAAGRILKTIEGLASGLGKVGQGIAGFVKGIGTTVSGVGQALSNGLNIGLDLEKQKLDRFMGDLKGMASSVANFKLPSLGKISIAGAGAGDGGAGKAAKTKKAAEPEWVTQYKSLVSEVASAQQEVVDGWGDPLLSLQSKYDKLDFSRGGVKALADAFLRAKDAIKAAALDKTISDQNDSIRVSILKMRDPSVEGAVAADIFKKAWKDLTLAERERVGQLVDNTKEQDRLTYSIERGKEAVLAQCKAYIAGITGPLKQWYETNIKAQEAEDKRIKGITDKVRNLNDEYKSLVMTGTAFDRFLMRTTGQTQESIKFTPGELERQKSLFTAETNAAQAEKLGGLTDKLRSMREELGLVKFSTTEARLAWEIWGTSIDKLAPEIQQKIKAMVPDFDRLTKLQKLKSQMEQVRSTITDVFKSAFDASLQRGESFFSSLALGFKNLLQQIVATWAANEAVKAIFSLFGKRYQGLATETADAEKHMVTGATAIGAASLALTAAAGKLAGAAAQAAASTSGMGGIPGVGMGFGAGGIGQTVGAVGGSVLGGIFSKQIGSALGAAGGPLGVLLGGAVGSLLGGLFSGKKKFFGLFANGGRPPVGIPSIVGDGGGPELFVPDQPGRIYSNRETNSILSSLGGGGGDIHLAKGGTVVINDRADVARIQAITRAKRQSRFRLS